MPSPEKKVTHMSEDKLPMVPISVGELIDKITILEIKLRHIEDPAKRENVSRELTALQAVRDRTVTALPEIDDLASALTEVNQIIWDTEDEIRCHERDQVFDSRFVTLARTAYLTNDRRAALKRRINALTSSHLVEEKSYSTDR